MTKRQQQQQREDISDTGLRLFLRTGRRISYLPREKARYLLQHGFYLELESMEMGTSFLRTIRWNGQESIFEFRQMSRAGIASSLFHRYESLEELVLDERLDLHVFVAHAIIDPVLEEIIKQLEAREKTEQGQKEEAPLRIGEEAS